MSRISHYHLFASLFCLALLASLLHPLHAQTPGEAVARVLFANGAVEAVREGESSRGLARGDMLFAGDTIKTGQGASAQFRFTDGALIALRADTLFTIEAHHHDPQDPQQSQQSGELLRGGLRAITGAIGRERPEAVNYRTPVATIGIRGTVFEAFYVPPEGLPGMPGVAPGHYVMVLRGQVSISNPAGDLSLAGGEIGYTPDSNTPPTLRPDLADLFAQLSALEASGQITSTITRVDDDTQEGDGQYEINLGNLDDELSQLAQLIEDDGEPEPQPQPEPEPEPQPEPDPAGPLALVLIKQEDGTFLTGHFLTTPVTMEGNALVSAENGSADGDLSEFISTANMTLNGNGTHATGDSNMTWGYYIDGSNNNTIDFITATNVLLTALDLPTTGNFTYYYAGGTGYVFDAESRLVVSFDNATMDVLLSVGAGDFVWSTNGASIADFYGNGLALTGAGDGTIVGRFVGGNAEGAMSYYVLNDGQFDVTGTAGFDRNLTLPQPEPIITAGPMGFVTIEDWSASAQQIFSARFFTDAMVFSGSDLLNATVGSGDFDVYDGSIAMGATGTWTTGDSTIHWGEYIGGEAYNGATLVNDPNAYVYYMAATQLLLTTNDLLPITGSKTYNYAGGAGNAIIDPSSHLTVNFDNATLDAWLIANHEVTESWSVQGAAITDFYTNGIELTNINPEFIYGTGTLEGRFVGSGAEGAITYYELPYWDGELVTGTALFDSNLTAYGPFGFITLYDDVSPSPIIYNGTFTNEPMTMSGEMLLSAYNGSGDIVSFDGVSTPGLTGSTVIGDSSVYWGSYSGTTFDARDINDVSLTQGIMEVPTAHYVSATRVLDNINDLPVTGTISYDYVGGAGDILSSGQLVVYFDTAQMDVDLVYPFDGDVFWSAANANISDFYGTGIQLNSGPLAGNMPGSINGRFVGSNAEGAIGFYELNNGEFIGTAVFDSTGGALVPQ